VLVGQSLVSVSCRDRGIFFVAEHLLHGTGSSGGGESAVPIDSSACFLLTNTSFLKNNNNSFSITALFW
jgi:hypothetical protein